MDEIEKEAKDLLQQVLEKEDKEEKKGEDTLKNFFEIEEKRQRIAPNIESLLLKDSEKMSLLKKLVARGEHKKEKERKQEDFRIKEDFVERIEELKNKGDFDQIDQAIQDYQERKEPLADEQEIKKLLKPIDEKTIIEEFQEVEDSIDTGFTLGGDIKLQFPGGAISAVVAPTGHGKTRALINFSLGVLKENPDKSLYFFTYEENRSAIVSLFLNTYIDEELSRNNRTTLKHYFKENDKDPFKYFIQGKVLAKEEETFQEIKDYFLEKKETFFKELIQTGRLNVIYSDYRVDQLTKNIKRLKEHKKDLALICIDYFQLLRDTSGKTPFYSRQEELKSICLKLKDCAIATGLPLVLAGQFNREVQKEEQMHPTRIGEAGDIERIANLILGIFDNQEEKKLLLEVLKGREIGAGHKVRLGYNGNTGRMDKVERVEKYKEL